MSAALDHLAARVATDPAFLAHRLAASAVTRSYGDAELCERLACTPEVLTRLRLCRAPGPTDDPTEYAAELRRRWEFDAAALAGMLG